MSGWGQLVGQGHPAGTLAAQFSGAAEYPYSPVLPALPLTPEERIMEDRRAYANAVAGYDSRVGSLNGSPPMPPDQPSAPIRHPVVSIGTALPEPGSSQMNRAVNIDLGLVSDSRGGYHGDSVDVSSASPYLPLADNRSDEQKKLEWEAAQAEYNKALSEKEKSTVNGIFNLAFPQASLLLGGEDEINRRYNIVNEVDKESQSNPQPIVLADEKPNQQQKPVITEPVAVPSVLPYKGSDARLREDALGLNPKDGQDLLNYAAEESRLLRDGFDKIDNLLIAPDNYAGTSFLRKTERVDSNTLTPAELAGIAQINTNRQAASKPTKTRSGLGSVMQPTIPADEASLFYGRSGDSSAAPQRNRMFGFDPATYNSLDPVARDRSGGTVRTGRLTTIDPKTGQAWTQVMGSSQESITAAKQRGSNKKNQQPAPPEPLLTDFLSPYQTGSAPKQNVPIDVNNLERYTATIPGKGTATGLRSIDPSRNNGTLSVVSGLSEGEKRLLAEINAREQQQREQDQLAAFMDRFTQPPGNMNPLQTQLWLNQQQQLGNFVKMQTEQQAAARLKQMELERERAKQNREQANEDRRFYAGRDDAAVNQFDQAEQRRLSALQHGQQKNNDLMKLANEWTKRYQVEKLDEMGGKSYALDTSRYARENAISDEPSTNELRPGQVYHSPSRGGFVVYDNNGTPAYFSLTDMVYAQLYNRLGGR